MKYAIIKVINGAFSVHAEGFTEVSAALVNYHGLAQTLWNAPDVQSAYIAIVDEQLDVAEGHKEFIHHEPAPEPEPEPEEDTASEYNGFLDPGEG